MQDPEVRTNMKNCTFLIERCITCNWSILNANILIMAIFAKQKTKFLDKHPNWAGGLCYFKIDNIQTALQ